MKLRTLLALITVFLFLPIYGQGQNEDTILAGPKKNAVYGTAGTLILVGAITVNYERMVWETKNKFFSSYWLKASYGGWYATSGFGDSAGGSAYIAGLTALTGSHNSHFELNAGLSYLVDHQGYDQDYQYFIDGWVLDEPQKPDYRALHPVVGFGYRFQKTDGGLIFRAGFGFPELVYLSFGFPF